MIIVGAGLAGLLAANMLGHRRPTVYEAQSSLPNNHSAVLRFKTAQIGDIVRIPFRKVTMIKCTMPYLNPVADALAYSFKNTGSYLSDRSINAGTVIEDRYIAPPDLIQRLAQNVNIEFNHKYKFEKTDKPVISTIPMMILMQELGYDHLNSFRFTNGVNICAKIHDCDAYVSLIVPDPRMPFSRISITGNEVIAECPKLGNDDVRSTLLAVAALLGIPFERFYDLSRHNQRYAKINSIDEDYRKTFMFWATDTHGIFSLGRFATWRPGLILDDLVKDIRLIDGWIERRHTLARHR